MSADEALNFFFLDAARLRALDKASPALLPPFQTLRDDPAWAGYLVKRPFDLQSACQGAHQRDTLAVSHRWLTAAQPDPDAAQLSAICQYLDVHPEVEWVWYDFFSVPQKVNGSARAPADQSLFGWTLQNVLWLYLTCSVLVLLDGQYGGRFWTCVELWTAQRLGESRSLQGSSAPAVTAAPCSSTGDAGGTRPEPDGAASGTMVCTRVTPRCAMMTMDETPLAVALAVASEWRSLDAESAQGRLASDEIHVTNQKDKEDLVDELLGFSWRSARYAAGEDGSLAAFHSTLKTPVSYADAEERSYADLLTSEAISHLEIIMGEKARPFTPAVTAATAAAVAKEATAATSVGEEPLVAADFLGAVRSFRGLHTRTTRQRLFRRVLEMIRLHAHAQDTSALRRAELQLSHQHVLHTRELLERRQVEVRQREDMLTMTKRRSVDNLHELQAAEQALTDTEVNLDSKLQEVIRAAQLAEGEAARAQATYEEARRAQAESLADEDQIAAQLAMARRRLQSAQATEAVSYILYATPSPSPSSRAPDPP